MATLDVYQIIKRPLITEQGMHLVEAENIYPFAVSPKANKVQIREAVERIFGVEVERVNTAHRKGKPRRRGRRVGRTQNWKKAYVKLRDGHSIELF